MVPKEYKPQEQDSIFRPDTFRDWNDIERIVEALASETNDHKIDTLARRLLDALDERAKDNARNSLLAGCSSKRVF